MRFELEQELVEGRLAIRDLPEAWNARYKEYLGVEVPDDAHGVLQDVHWAAGLIGYFPTYALGNLIAGQLFARAHEELPDLDAQIGAGELHGLREWLREHVHRHGAKFSTTELLDRVVGGPIAVRSVRRLPEGEAQSGVRRGASLTAGDPHADRRTRAAGGLRGERHANLAH